MNKISSHLDRFSIFDGEINEFSISNVCSSAEIENSIFVYALLSLTFGLNKIKSHLEVHKESQPIRFKNKTKTQIKVFFRLEKVNRMKGLMEYLRWRCVAVPRIFISCLWWWKLRIPISTTCLAY